MKIFATILLFVSMAPAQLLTMKSGPGAAGAASFAATTLEASCVGTNTASPATCGTSLSVSAGDTIVCFVGQWSFGSVGGYVSDATNGVYKSVLEGLFNSDTGHYGMVWAVFNAPAATVTPTAIFGGSTSGATLSCRAWKGVATSNVIDGGAGVTDINPANGVGITSTNPNGGTAATPTNDKEVIDCGMFNIANVVPTAGASYTLTTRAAAGQVNLSPEYWIQTTKTSTNCPYTAASDTWSVLSVALENAGATVGGVSPFTEMFADYAGNANAAAVTAANLATGSYTSVHGNGGSGPGWSINAITTAVYSNSTNIPSKLNSAWVNGTTRNSNPGLAITKAANTSTETWKFTFNVPFVQFGAIGFAVSTNFSLNDVGDICDVAQMSTGGGGDGITPQYYYAAYNLTSVATASGGSTVYTGTIGDGNSNAPGTVGVAGNLIGKTVVITGFVTGANNGTFTISASNGTTITVNNANGVSETHAGLATDGLRIRMELTNGVNTFTSAGITLPSENIAYYVTNKVNWGASGVHSMTIYNATSGALIGSETIPITNLGLPVAASLVLALWGGQGSCGFPGGTTISYGTLAAAPFGQGYPLLP